MKNLLLPLFLLAVTFLSAQETMILGQEDLWQGAYTQGLQQRVGREGFLDLTLAHGESLPGAESQWLLGFDGRVNNPTGLYRVLESPATQQNLIRRGSGAALFEGDTPLIMEPRPGALFYPYSHWEDFTLQFWLYPANLQEGEVLVQWKGFLRNQQEILPQELLCRVTGRKIQWNFSNFFLPPQGGESYFILEGDPLIPRRWSHHMLRYNHELGLLEYLIDGVPAGVLHTTPSGREEAEIYQPRIEQAQPTPVVIGQDYNGLMDELSFSSEWLEAPSLLDYEAPGYYLSPIIDMEYQDSLLGHIRPTQSLIGESQIHYYYYISNRKDQAERARNEMMGQQRPEQELQSWNPMEENGFLPMDKGRYLVIAAVLYPDMGLEESPSLSSLEIQYTKHLPPVPPLNLQAYSQDGEIHLRWDYSDNSEIAGFYIYYGQRPGEYFGAGSPIEVSGPTNHYVLRGLDRYQTWYISMVSYNQSIPAQRSDFSQEVAVRP